MEEAFEYGERLDDGQIRVLVVDRGRFGHPIKCSLHVHTLDESPQYEALSYAWGDPTLCEHIWIDNKRCPVTKSLNEALQYMQSRCKKMRIWVDAVCINQNDISEKNAQVQNMSAIFGRAFRTRAWIGVPTPGLENALEVVVKLAEHFTHEQVIQYRDCILAVLLRPWFSRLWVWQEIALAQQCVVVCGYSNCSIQSLFQFHRRWRGLGVALRLAVDPGHDLPGHLSDALENLRGMRLTFAEVQSRQGSSFISLLRRSSTALCVEPRDHIFALRGIYERVSGGDRIPSEVDYNLDVSALFTHSTCEALLRPKGIEALIRALSSTGRHKAARGAGVRRHELPSWVPDWADDSRSVGYLGPSSYAAGGDSEIKLSRDMFTASGRRLTLHGLSMCAVRDTCYVAEQRSQTDWESLEQWAFSDRSPALPDLGSRETLEAFARTLIADMLLPLDGFDYKRWPADDDRLSRKPWRSIESLDNRLAAGAGNTSDGAALSADQYAFEYCRSVACYGRRCITTTSGHFALGPGDSQPDDELIVFPGVTMPLLLRRRSNGTTYELIGPAYLHGFMDGEAIEALGRGKYELRDFEID